MRYAIAVSFGLLAGCSVRLETQGAVAEALSERETRRLAGLGTAPSGTGTWYRVTALLPRGSVRSIARWELYTHIVVEDCRTGATRAVVSSAEVEATKGDFQAIGKLLESQPRRRVFALGGPAFIRAGTPTEGLCLHLEGGSYTLQKIASAPVRLRFRA